MRTRLRHTTYGLFSLLVVLLGLKAEAADPFFDRDFASDQKLAEYLQYHHPQELNLVGSNVSAEGLKVLRTASGIERLQLAGRTVPEDLLQDIAHLRQLRMLNLGQTNVTDASLRTIGEFKSLLFLSLGQTQVTDRALIPIGQLPELIALELSDCPITDAGLNHLKDLHALDGLYLVNTETGDEAIRIIAQDHPQVNTLWVGRRTTDAAIPDLLKLKNLRQLGLVNCEISEEGIARLAAESDLGSLAISGPDVSDGVLKSLPSLKLWELRCYKLRRTEGGLAALKNLPTVTHLILNESPYTDQDIQVLREMPQLQYLWLEETAITDASLETLRGLPNLVSAFVYGPQISQKGCDELRSFLNERLLTVYAENEEEGQNGNQACPSRNCPVLLRSRRHFNGWLHRAARRNHACPRNPCRDSRSRSSPVARRCERSLPRWRWASSAP